jgi:Glycosyl transferase WecG/TagA/CpsF family
VSPNTIDRDHSAKLLTAVFWLPEPYNSADVVDFICHAFVQLTERIVQQLGKLNDRFEPLDILRGNLTHEKTLDTPQQEVPAGRIADHPQARGVGLCVGASIYFLTGRQRRAPVWLKRLAWNGSTLFSPRRLASRYLGERPRIF